MSAAPAGSDGIVDWSPDALVPAPAEQSAGAVPSSCAAKPSSAAAIAARPVLTLLILLDALSRGSRVWLVKEGYECASAATV